MVPTTGRTLAVRSPEAAQPPLASAPCLAALLSGCPAARGLTLSFSTSGGVIRADVGFAAIGVLLAAAYVREPDKIKSARRGTGMAPVAGQTRALDRSRGIYRPLAVEG